VLIAEGGSGDNRGLKSAPCTSAQVVDEMPIIADFSAFLIVAQMSTIADSSATCCSGELRNIHAVLSSSNRRRLRKNFHFAL
jgi:hypothetical protein